jgi:hypothetical protein
MASTPIHAVDGLRGASAPLIPVVRSRADRSLAHGTLLVGFLLAMSLGFGLALLRDSPLFALGVLLVLLISTAVIAVAWMRPGSGSVEHHPKIDHYLDDSSP